MCVQIQPALRVNGRNREASGCTRNYRTGCPRSRPIRSLKNLVQTGLSFLNTDFTTDVVKFYLKKKKRKNVGNEKGIICDIKEINVDSRV